MTRVVLGLVIIETRVQICIDIKSTNCWYIPFWDSRTASEKILIFLSIPLAFTNFAYKQAKLLYYHENSERFPCLYHIPRFSTAFSVKLIHLSAKTANIIHLFTFSLYTITEPPDFCLIVYFCLIVRFFPQSPSYQRHQKTKKLVGSTTHRDEPHQA